MRIKPIKDGEQLLFSSEENKPLYLDYVNHNLKIIIKENNLKHITLHGFRHTHCSLLFESGASVKEVYVRLGHTDIKTTMDDIYTHIGKKKTEETAIRFADFMSSTGQEKQGSLQKVKSMVKKKKKSRLSLLDSLLNVELSVFFLFRSVCVFETVLILFFNFILFQPKNVI
jgi:ribosome-binding ATPase YchF (GTP1/OBG family)